MNFIKAMNFIKEINKQIQEGINVTNFIQVNHLINPMNHGGEFKDTNLTKLKFIFIMMKDLIYMI